MKEILFNEPFVTGKEIEYIKDVMKLRSFSGNGKYTKRVQEFLQNKFQVKHVLLTHSCTAALELSAILFDIKPGDEVILPSYTFCSTASAFLRNGAKLVFCEIDPKTMNMDLDDVVSRVTSKTKMIVPVHYAGLGVDVLKLKSMLPRQDIVIVEDAAQGLNAKIDGRWLGTLGDVGCFSFHETKNLQCGLGGAIFINDDKLFDRAENIWERGTNRTKMFRGLVDKYSWVDMGSSFYPSELQAAFLYAQLEALEENTEQRTKIWNLYREKFQKLCDSLGVGLQQVDLGRCQMNGHAFYLQCRSVVECDALRLHLKSKGIGAVIHYVPLHNSKMGLSLGNHDNDLPITEKYAPQILRLPMHYNLTPADVEAVFAAVQDFFSKA